MKTLVRWTMITIAALWSYGLTLAIAMDARAQAGVPLGACVDRAPLPVPAPAAPTCLPEALGGPGKLILEAGGTGGAAAWWCAPAGGPVSLHLYAVRWSALTPAMVLDAAALGLPGDNSARIKAMMSRATADARDMCDVWGPARERINAAMPPPTPALPPPPAERWAVARFSVQLTRPAFAAANGVRSTIAATTRAPVGAACDCARPIVESLVTYCPWTGGAPGFVTVCTRQ